MNQGRRRYVKGALPKSHILSSHKSDHCTSLTLLSFCDLYCAMVYFQTVCFRAITHINLSLNMHYPFSCIYSVYICVIHHVCLSILPCHGNPLRLLPYICTLSFSKQKSIFMFELSPSSFHTHKFHLWLYLPQLKSIQI